MPLRNFLHEQPAFDKREPRIMTIKLFGRPISLFFQSVAFPRYGEIQEEVTLCLFSTTLRAAGAWLQARTTRDLASRGVI
jgi:hypothetical protein